MLQLGPAPSLSPPGREGHGKNGSLPVRVRAAPKTHKTCPIVKRELTGACMLQTGSISTVVREESPPKKNNRRRRSDPKYEIAVWTGRSSSIRNENKIYGGSSDFKHRVAD